MVKRRFVVCGEEFVFAFSACVELLQPKRFYQIVFRQSLHLLLAPIALRSSGTCSLAAVRDSGGETTEGYFGGQLIGFLLSVSLRTLSISLRMDSSHGGRISLDPSFSSGSSPVYPAPLVALYGGGPRGSPQYREGNQ